MLSSRSNLALGIVFVFGLLLSCNFYNLVEANAKRNRRLDRSWKSRKRACETNVDFGCTEIHPDENDNCVNKCISPLCFAEVYGTEGLEPGEVDHMLWRSFTACLRQEVKNGITRKNDRD